MANCMVPKRRPLAVKGLIIVTASISKGSNSCHVHHVNLSTSSPKTRWSCQIVKYLGVKKRKSVLASRAVPDRLLLCNMPHLVALASHSPTNLLSNLNVNWGDTILSRASVYFCVFLLCRLFISVYVSQLTAVPRAYYVI